MFDGDYGAEACDFVDVGAFDVADEVACICREGFDIATLAFGIDGCRTI